MAEEQTRNTNFTVVTRMVGPTAFHTLLVFDRGIRLDRSTKPAVHCRLDRVQKLGWLQRTRNSEKKASLFLRCCCGERLPITTPLINATLCVRSKRPGSADRRSITAVFALGPWWPLCVRRALGLLFVADEERSSLTPLLMPRFHGRARSTDWFAY